MCEFFVKINPNFSAFSEIGIKFYTKIYQANVSNPGRKKVFKLARKTKRIISKNKDVTNLNNIDGETRDGKTLRG